MDRARLSRILPIGLLLAAVTVAGCGGDDAVEPAPCAGVYARDAAGNCTAWRTVVPFESFADGPLLPLSDGRVAALEHFRRVYDASTGMWKSITLAPFSRVDSATLLGTHVVTQGREDEGDALYYALWDPVADRWSERRPSESSAWVRMYPIPGGVLVQGAGTDAQTGNGVGRFWILRESTSGLALVDPVATENPPLQLVTGNGGASIAGGTGGQVLFVGGHSPDETGAWVFDVASGHFVQTTSLPMPREQFTTLALRSGDAMILGGVDHDGARTTTAATYAAATRTWRMLAPMPAAMIAPTAIELTDGKVLVLGGQTAVAHRYDPAADRWDVVALPKTNEAAPSFRGWPAAALPGGHAIAEIERTTYVYDPQ